MLDDQAFWTIWFTVMIPPVIIFVIVSVWLSYLLWQVEADDRKYHGRG